MDECINDFASYFNSNENQATFQLVLLGAGLDARAYRLTSLSKASVFELDIEPVIEYKSSILQNEQPLCVELSRVKSDLKEGTMKKRHLLPLIKSLTQNGASLTKTVANNPHSGETQSESNGRSSLNSVKSGPLKAGRLFCKQLPSWANELFKCGFDSGLPTIFICEGILMYFNVHECAHLLDVLSSITENADSLICSDFPNAATAGSRQSYFRLYQSGFDIDVTERLLILCNWEMMNVRIISRDDLSYDRYLREHLKHETTGKDMFSYIVRARVRKYKKHFSSHLFNRLQY